MQFDILTLFPEIINSYGAESILGRGQKAGAIKISAHNFRDFTLNKQNHVDDRPYGGGAGMVLQVEPIYRCLESLGVLSLRGAKRRSNLQNQGIAALPAVARNDRKIKIIIMDPAGKKFDQKMAEKFSKLDRLVIVSGRYEGFDERIYKFVDEKISVGDYVLAGGELPALTIVEAVSRLIPGVLGNAESLKEETFNKSKIQISNAKSNPKSKGQKLSARGGSAFGGEIGNSDFDISVEYPQYTRPDNFMGLKVPKILLSGDHKKIAEWREKKSK